MYFMFRFLFASLNLNVKVCKTERKKHSQTTLFYLEDEVYLSTPDKTLAPYRIYREKTHFE